MNGIHELIQTIHRLETEAYQHGMRNGSANGTAIYRDGRGGPEVGGPHAVARADVMRCLERMGLIIVCSRCNGGGNDDANAGMCDGCDGDGYFAVLDNTIPG